jgi:hypothetical protein
MAGRWPGEPPVVGRGRLDSHQLHPTRSDMRLHQQDRRERHDQSPPISIVEQFARAGHRVSGSGVEL